MNDGSVDDRELLWRVYFQTYPPRSTRSRRFSRPSSPRWSPRRSRRGILRRVNQNTSASPTRRASPAARAAPRTRPEQKLEEQKHEDEEGFVRILHGEDVARATVLAIVRLARVRPPRRGRRRRRGGRFPTRGPHGYGLTRGAE